MLPDLTGSYSVKVAGVELCGKAWLLRNPPVLLGSMPRRDTSIELPLGGSVPRPQPLGTREVSLRFVFVGDCDRTGTAASDPRVQLLTNLDWFEANVVNATPGGDNTLAVTVQPYGGATKTGKLQFVGGLERGGTESSDGQTTSLCVLRAKLFGALA